MQTTSMCTAVVRGLLQVLCYLVVEPAHQPVVREILDYPLKTCPEVRGLVVGCCHKGSPAQVVPVPGLA